VHAALGGLRIVPVAMVQLTVGCAFKVTEWNGTIVETTICLQQSRLGTVGKIQEIS
jgi:hypothetical protein